MRNPFLCPTKVDVLGSQKGREGTETERTVKCREDAGQEQFSVREESVGFRMIEQAGERLTRGVG